MLYAVLALILLLLQIEYFSLGMEDQSNAGPPSKRQRTIAIANDAITTSGTTNNLTTSSPQNEGVLTAVNKLTTLVEGHPRLSIHCIGFITN